MVVGGRFPRKWRTRFRQTASQPRWHVLFFVSALQDQCLLLLRVYNLKTAGVSASEDEAEVTQRQVLT